MKILKVLSTAAVSVALAASMAVTASAATYTDAVQAAKDNGVQANNVKELENFLEPNQDYFTAAQYDDMIADINAIGEKYVAPLAKELFDKTPAELTEDEKIDLGQHWTQDDRTAIINDLVALGKKYDVVITATQLDRAHYHVEAYIKGSESDDSGKSGNTTDDGKDKDGKDTAGSTDKKDDNKGGNVQTASDKPVADTGAEDEAETNAASVAALFTVALAACGIAVVARKNKA